MQFGMSTACLFPDQLIEDAVDLIGGMGIDTIEVFFSCLTEYKPAFVAELKRRVQAQGIRVYSIHAFSLQFEPQLFTRHVRARREAEDICRRVLEAGTALGAGVYVFHGPVNLKRLPHRCLDYDDIARRTDVIADMAAEYGIRLAWENVHYCCYERPDFAREMLRRTRSRNLYFTLDVKQAAQAGFRPEDFLADTAGRLANIHLCDYVIGDAGVAPRLPFSGDMDYAAFKRALIEIGYDGGMILEVYRHNYSDHAQLAANFARMRDFFS
jgi:sugar phosphate isomerase/epimerase